MLLFVWNIIARYISYSTKMSKIWSNPVINVSVKTIYFSNEFKFYLECKNTSALAAAAMSSMTWAGPPMNDVPVSERTSNPRRSSSRNAPSLIVNIRKCQCSGEINFSNWTDCEQCSSSMPPNVREPPTTEFWIHGHLSHSKTTIKVVELRSLHLLLDKYKRCEARLVH